MVARHQRQPTCVDRSMPCHCYVKSLHQKHRHTKSTLRSAKTKQAKVYSMNTKLGRNVPQVRIVVNGMIGLAHIDIAGRMSLASLYQKFCQMKWRFSQTMVNPRLADGSCRLQKSMVIT